MKPHLLRESLAMETCVCGGPGEGARWGVVLLVTLWAAGCHCADKDPHTSCDHRFVSGIVKNGTLTSVDYPNPYPSPSRCNYTFEGEIGERVQLLFIAFDLHQDQVQEPPKDCEGEDVVMVFVDIEGRKERLDNYCGNNLPPQVMSSSPNMQLEMRTYHPSNDVSGFRAIYRFVSNYGITSGRHVPENGCSFIFNSTERSNGTFTSPNWPGLYPRSTKCEYLFYGKGQERVHITFAYFDVDGQPPCTEDTASDYVEFSNFRTVDRKIPRHCGIRTPKVIESDGDFFRIIFRSNNKFDATGFEAFYQFRSFVDPFTVKRVSVAQSSASKIFLGLQKMATHPLLMAVFIMLYL